MGIGASGLMSGLDTESIISQMMQLERRPIVQLQRKEAGYQAQISALGTLKGTLSSLQSAVEDLADVDTFKAHKASSSDTDVLTVSSSSALNAGEYNMWVQQLAQAEHAYSSTFADSDTTTLGTGTITIQLGSGTAVDIAIDDTNNTLDGIAEAINDSDAELTASVFDDGTGNYSLMLAGDKTGKDNTITFTIADDDGNDTDAAGLSQLYFDPATESMDNTDHAAKNAILYWDTAANGYGGTPVERTSNTIDDLITGVTLTLNQVQGTQPPDATAEGSAVTVTVTSNPDSVAGKVEKFVNEYNNLITTLDNLQFYDADSGQSGALQGDALVRRVEARFRDFLYAEVDGVASEVNGLSQLGVEVDSDGKLTFDATVFTEALEDDQNDVINFFTQETEGSEGLAVQLEALLDDYLESDGLIEGKQDGLQSSVDRIGDQVERIEVRLAKREENLRRQFEALELLMAEFQATSGTLDRQLQSISNLNASISKMKK